ncbi:MAG: hypothetical protein AOA66_0718 [Candidatus Bathyarchaeota archaeon BA2]|nr:MAG: hypothetical protein AOA66_0718 [Candidatus Bathyarchaeota archaeon BA2]
MEELRLSVKDKQDARMALLSYYSSECIAHGAYLVALAVGFLGLVEATPHILEFATRVFSPTLPEELARRIILGLMASGFIVLVIYVLGRAVFWGYLRSAILNVKPKEGSRVEFKPGTTVTFMQQLHEACFDHAKNKHRIWTKIYGLRAGHLALIWLDLFILFLIISVVLLYVL